MDTGGAGTSAEGTRPLTTANVIADHAGFNRGPYRLAPTLLRSRTVSARSILAHVVSGGRLTADELDSLGTGSAPKDVVSLLEPQAAGVYARVLAHQADGKGQEQAAIELFRALVEVHGRNTLAQGDRNLFAQLLGKHRYREDLVELLAGADDSDSGLTRDVEAALRADLHNPFLYEGQDEDRFVELFNAAVDPGARPPVRLSTVGVTAFDRLAPADLERIDGPLITVVTSCFNPDHALIGAARSLIGQSWSNWEMLIVDDASTDPSAPALLREVALLDPRIRVIRKKVNGGTYRARNTALMQARGSFMTFLDSDDWAHPERLVEGVRPMLESSGIMATRSFGARVTEQLELTRPGYPTHFSTAASLMFRIPEVPARVGFFDTVRKSADTEYTRRIEAAFGHRVHDIRDRALTIVRRAEGTLSSADFSYGWQHQSRWAYKQAYRTAHRQISEGADGFREPHEPSRFFGAHRWAKPGDPEYRLNRHFDVVLAGDWRRFGGPQVSMLEEIAALREGGYRVGVMHLEAMRFRTEKDQPLCGPLRALLRERKVELVFADDDADIDLLILRYPPILQFPPLVRDAVRPKKLFIMANQAPCEPDGSDQRYVPVDVHRHAAELFGVEPRWIPQSGVIRRILEPLLPADVMTTWDNPGIIDAREWHSRRSRPSREQPVIGRFSRDDKIKFPGSGAELLSAYGFPPPYQVRFMGAAGQVKRLLSEVEAPVPDNWTVLPHGAMDAREFVRDVDVVVYMDRADANEAFGRVLLESAASGALVVASPKHEVNFGDALVYAEPDGVRDAVAAYLERPEMFRAQVSRSLERVRERWSYDSFRRRIQTELDELASARPTTLTSSVIAQPAGEFVVRRVGEQGGVVIDTEPDALAGFVVPLRRQADAELVDYLVIAHDAGHPGGVADLADRIRALHRPGTVPRVLDEPLPPGVHALIYHADGEWAVRVRRGGLVTRTSSVCRLTFTV